MRNWFWWIIGIIALILVVYLRWDKIPGPQVATVANVDLAAYQGKWYEIALLPNYFERNCRCSTAEYKAEKKFIAVTNRCWRNNQWETATAKAYPVDHSGNAKLKVQFFWPFRANYWIIYLDPHYQYAMVGNPKRDSLWILARKPQINETQLHTMIMSAALQGFPVDQLVFTDQTCW